MLRLVSGLVAKVTNKKEQNSFHKSKISEFCSFFIIYISRNTVINISHVIIHLTLFQIFIILIK
jgi:hypothetical protein